MGDEAVGVGFVAQRWGEGCSVTTIANQFTKRKRPTGIVWVHKSLPVWVVLYEAMPGRHKTHYRAYRCIDKVPKGRELWTVDNRSVGPQDGFQSLTAAMRAVVGAVK